MASFELTPGQRLRVLHRSETQKYTRESVMIFLEKIDNQLVFSARPVAGTQTLPVSWIIGVWPTSEPIKINGRAR